MFQALQDYPYIIPDILRMFKTVITFLLQMSSFLAQVRPISREETNISKLVELVLVIVSENITISEHTLQMFAVKTVGSSSYL